MQGNIIGQSGMFVNDSLFPIYQQLNQPIQYNGIWIKTEDNLKDVYFQTDDVRECEEVNSLPYSLGDYGDSGCVTSVGSDIYLFGGDDGDKFKAYKYDSIGKTYTKLADIPSPGATNQAVAATETEIYLTVTSNIYKYDISTDEYTKLTNSSIIVGTTKGSEMTLVDGNIYIFSSSDEEYRERAIKYNIENDLITHLKDIPDYSLSGSVVAINDNEICLFSVYMSSMNYYSCKYNITENEYYENGNIFGSGISNTKINNYVYIAEDNSTNAVFEGDILEKYSIKNNSFYRYNKKANYINDTKIDILQLAHANNDLYLLTSDKLYKSKIKADYKGDGIYVILQETSLAKDLDVSNILDVKKIVDGEEQDILVYIGDGESWKLLNGSDTTQTTNALQYALSFKEES